MTKTSNLGLVNATWDAKVWAAGKEKGRNSPVAIGCSETCPEHKDKKENEQTFGDCRKNEASAQGPFIY